MICESWVRSAKRARAYLLAVSLMEQGRSARLARPSLLQDGVRSESRRSGGATDNGGKDEVAARSMVV